jgi:uncharacterized protein (UPF0264 family)
MVTALPRAAADFHTLGKEGWLAGSIAREEPPGSRATGVDVICVRGAVSESIDRLLRFRMVQTSTLRELVATITKMPT